MHNERHLIEFLSLKHFGERVAQTNYVGQQAALKNQPEAEKLQYMMEKDEIHLDTFDSLLKENQVRPFLLDPSLRFAGFSLGMISAALGPKAAMACTIAVEELVGSHY